eukprot:5895959-Prymnesium_polylepis.1
MGVTPTVARCTFVAKAGACVASDEHVPCPPIAHHRGRHAHKLGKMIQQCIDELAQDLWATKPWEGA